jgi:2-dehydropantoate 2-reductase
MINRQVRLKSRPAKLAIAQRESITVPGDSWQGVERITATMPGQFSSTAQDLMRGRRSEIDHLNGYIVRRGKSLAIDTPANQTLYFIVKLLETACGSRTRPHPL